MFINLSNHPASLWSEQHLMAAKQYGEVIDMPFPWISPYASEDEIEILVEDYRQRVLAYGKPTVMLQGEFVFTYRLTKKLKEDGLLVLASCTDRKTEEKREKNGRTTKLSVFEFVGFRKY